MHVRYLNRSGITSDVPKFHPSDLFSQTWALRKQKITFSIQSHLENVAQRKLHMQSGKAESIGYYLIRPQAGHYSMQKNLNTVSITKLELMTELLPGNPRRYTTLCSDCKIWSPKQWKNVIQ